VGIVSIPVLLFMIWYPHFFADQLPRLFFIPVLFGGAVVFLAEVAAWSKRLQAANNCAGDASLCPRPILIAGAGGAGRAGFLTATVTGALIDLGGDIR